MISGHFLVRGNTIDAIIGSSGHRHSDELPPSAGNDVITDDSHHTNKEIYQPMVISDTSISFWGGIDPITGIVIDTFHPLVHTCITDTILCIPSVCGSCTTSQIVLECILNRTIPHTIIVCSSSDGDDDGTNHALLSIGPIIAQEFFTTANTPSTPSTDKQQQQSSIKICNILCIDETQYQDLLNISSKTTSSTSEHSLYGHITSTGELRIRTNDGTMIQLPSSSSSIPTTTTTTTTIPKDDQVTTNEITTATTLQQGHKTDTILVLSEEEQMYMDQATTDAERMAYKVIFRYSKLSSTSATCNTIIDSDDDNNKTAATTTTTTKPRYIPIQQSHIDGCTYIGPGGIQLVQRLCAAGGRVKVPTTLNAGSTDRRYWQQYHVPAQYATNAIVLGDAYIELGCQPTFTCAPYLLLQKPTVPESVSTLDTSQPMVTTTAKSNSLRNSRSTNTLLGQDIAWGESNAVVYANSVLGARTEKYADYLDICCAITGIVPNIGVHVTKNRIPTIVLDGTTTFQMIQALINSSTDSVDEATILDLDVLFPILGHLCGRLSKGRLPILTGFDHDIVYWDNLISTDHLKAFCAAFGTTASSPLIHIAGITPEARNPITIQNFVAACDPTRQQTITLCDLYETYQKFNTNDANNGRESIDLVALGNPHLSVSECTDLARTIQQMSATTTKAAIASEPIDQLQSTATTSLSRAKSRIIACISREIYAQISPNDVGVMSEFGIEFIFDTCWCMILDEPIIPHNPLGIIMTNSGKYAHYGPGLTKRQFRFGSMYDCIYAARHGFSPYRTTMTISSPLQQQSISPEHQQSNAVTDTPKQLKPLLSSSFTDKSTLTDTTNVTSSSSPSSSMSPIFTSSMQKVDPYLSFLVRPTSASLRKNYHVHNDHRRNQPIRRNASSLRPHRPALASILVKVPHRMAIAARTNTIFSVVSSFIKMCCR